MTILFASRHHSDSDAWVQAFRDALPEFTVIDWHPDLPETGAELAIVWSPPATLLEQEPRLRAMFNLGAGVDAILALPGLRQDMAVFRLEDAGMAVQMAEYVVHALTRMARGFDAYDALQRRGRWERLPDIDRQRWPVGILGLGLMGRRVAQAVAALDYPVAGWSRSPKDVGGVTTFSGQEGLAPFLRQTRVLVNVLPLTADTHHILNRATFQQLLPDAAVINIGRGGHLNEADLLAMLDAGHVRSAVLDVFEEEPLPAAHPFWSHPGVTVTPHIAAASLRRQTVAQIAGKVRAWHDGRPVSGRVAHVQGY